MFKSMKYLVGLLLCLQAMASPFSEAFVPLQPVDEGAKDASFAEYRQNLLAVLQRKDAQELKKFLSPQIEYTFGLGKPGVTGFYSVWKPEKPDSRLWSELTRVVKAGGVSPRAGEFVAPYWYLNWPSGKDDLEWVAVPEDGVAVYFEPRLASKRLPDIGRCLVHRSEVERHQRHQGWTCIDLPESMQNPFKVAQVFVQTRDLQPRLGYRATFEKTEKGWRLASFVAGD